MFGWNFEKMPPEKLPEEEEHWGITTKDHEGVKHYLQLDFDSRYFSIKRLRIERARRPVNK
jgi:hypothetical protein